jgi:Zn-dependent protease with chaperone function
MINVGELRHPKETGYFTVMAVVSGIIWLPLIPLAFIGFPFSIPFMISAWLSSLYFKAVILGDSVKVSVEQYPEIHERAAHMAREMGLPATPDIFIVNSNGIINAVAFKMLGKKYIFLYSSLVDLLLMKGHKEELDFILGHELGHHAAGHVSTWKNIFLFWGKMVPFVGSAYSRACELTADRIGHHFVDDVKVSTRALGAIALGSGTLVDRLSVDAFKRQDAEIPEFMGFIHKIFSSHPRTTRRIIEIEAFQEYNRFLKERTTSAGGQQQTSGASTSGATVFCSACGTKNSSQAAFCESCGNKLK